MPASLLRSLGFAAVAALLAACGGETTTTPDGGTSSVCEITNKNKPETAQQLTFDVPYPGEADPVDTCIFPLKIQRWFWVDVPAGLPLLSVDVAFPSQAKSKVNLVYQILADPPDFEHPVGVQADKVETVHASHVTGTHYIPVPGKYYIVVRDAGDNAQDDLNTFTIKASAAADPDVNEGQAGGNNDCAHAVDLPSGSSKEGYIAYQGDKDAFKVNVPAGSKIIQLQVDYTGTLLSGRLKTELYQPDGQTLVYEDTAQPGATPSLLTRRGVISPGADYCIIIHDVEDTAADPTTKYTVSVEIQAEPDQNEQSSRNDSPATATDVGGGGSRTGYIASTGDPDWYRVSQTPGDLLELRAQGSSSTLKLGMKIVYPHDTTPCSCSGGACESCAYLTGTTTCTLPTDCASNQCQRGKCALYCKSNLDCPSRLCSAGACAAGGECLPEGQCAVTQFVKPYEATQPNDVHTVQPAQAPTTYVLVYDTNSPPTYDPGTAYTFTFAAHAEPDAEPDNFYNPDLTLENPDTTPGEVIAKNWSYGRPGSGNTAAGFISYEGDIDLWEFPNPCGTGLCSIRIDVTASTSVIDYVFFGYDNHHLNFSWRARNNGLTFGDTLDECGFIEGNTLNLIVRDWYHSSWDWTTGYSLTVTGVAGCGFGCIDYPGGTCQPGN